MPIDPNFTIEQFTEWVNETFPDNISRLIKEQDLRDGLINMAEFSIANKEDVQVLHDQTVAYAGQVESAAIGSKTQNMGRFSNITQFAKQKISRILYGGTSIANSSLSAPRVYFSELIRRFGDSGNTTELFSMLGGNQTDLYLGWAKQNFGGFGFVRLRGTSASTLMKFSRYMKRCVIRYSKEADGGSFDLYVDGVLSQAINSNGAQSYGNEIVLTWPAAQLRTIEIRPPAAGYAYLETVDYCEDNNGIHILDATKGGTAVKSFFTPAVAEGAQVAPVVVTGNNGIDSLYNNISANFKPDLCVFTWCVNDAGGGIAQFNTTYKPALDRVVQKTKENDIPIIFVVEMGGHYSMPADANYATFQAIRSLLLSYRFESHVSVLDWHGKAGLQDNTSADFERLALKYYPISAVNYNAGTYTGDFVHPNSAGYAILSDMLFVESGINATGLQGTTAGKLKDIGKQRTELAVAGTPMYSEKYIVPGISKEDINTIGLKRPYRMIGVSRQGLINKIEPLWYSASEMNYSDAQNTYIAAAATSDDFGAFRSIPTGAPYGSGLIVPSPSSAFPAAFTVTVIAGPGDFLVRVRRSTSTLFLDGVAKGQTYIGLSDIVGVNETDAPQVYHLSISQHQGADNPFLSIAGKIYAVYVTPTLFACIPEKKLSTARTIVPLLKMVGDIPLDKVIEQQLYHETINGKVIEKICIGKDIYKPLSATDKFFGLYRLQNRSAVDIQVLTLNGTITYSAFNEKYGGVLKTTDSGTPYFASVSNFDNTYADKTYTVTGFLPTELKGISVSLASTTGALFLRLQADGTWLAGAAVDLTNAFTHNGRPLAFTFVMPNAAQFDVRAWQLRVAKVAGGATTYGDYVLCEGSSATV